MKTHLLKSCILQYIMDNHCYQLVMQFVLAMAYFFISYRSTRFSEKKRHPVLKTNPSVLFIECTEMNWKTSDVNGLCVSIFLDKMGWLLGVKGRFHNDERLMYIFTGNVENGTPIIFHKTIYSSWYK